MFLSILWKTKDHIICLFVDKNLDYFLTFPHSMLMVFLKAAIKVFLLVLFVTEYYIAINQILNNHKMIWRKMFMI